MLKSLRRKMKANLLQPAVASKIYAQRAKYRNPMVGFAPCFGYIYFISQGTRFIVIKEINVMLRGLKKESAGNLVV